MADFYPGRGRTTDFRQILRNRLSQNDPYATPYAPPFDTSVLGFLHLMGVRDPYPSQPHPTGFASPQWWGAANPETSGITPSPFFMGRPFRWETQPPPGSTDLANPNYIPAQWAHPWSRA